MATKTPQLQYQSYTSHTAGRLNLHFGFGRHRRIHVQLPARSKGRHTWQLHNKGYCRSRGSQARSEVHQSAMAQHIAGPFDVVALQQGSDHLQLSRGGPQRRLPWHRSPLQQGYVRRTNECEEDREPRKREINRKDHQVLEAVIASAPFWRPPQSLIR